MIGLEIFFFFFSSTVIMSLSMIWGLEFLVFLWSMTKSSSSSSSSMFSPSGACWVPFCWLFLFHFESFKLPSLFDKAIVELGEYRNNDNDGQPRKWNPDKLKLELAETYGAFITGPEILNPVSAFRLAIQGGISFGILERNGSHDEKEKEDDEDFVVEEKSILFHKDAMVGA